MERNHLSEAKRQLLDRFLQNGCTATAGAEESIHRTWSKEPAPLSLSQEQLWRRETSNPGIPPLYNECVHLHMVGPLDAGSLEKSLCGVIRRHEIWRTSYDACDGRPIQTVHPAPEAVQVPVIDLTSCHPASTQAVVLEEAGSLVREPFDLQAGPLLRFKLIRTGEFEHHLLVGAHLSIVDGVSVYQVFPRELAQLYRAFSSRQKIPFPDLTVQFGDYARWQRSPAQRERRDEHRQYWKKKLAGALLQPSWGNRARSPRGRPFEGKIHPFVFSHDAVRAVENLSQREAITPFTVLASAFAALLQRNTGQEDVLIGTPSPSGRKRSEVDGLLGYFLNPVLLRFDLSGGSSVHEFLLRSQRMILEAVSNDDVPLEDLAAEIAFPTNGAGYPFFRVAISLQPPTPPLGLDWRVTSMDVSSGGAPWDLYIAFIRHPTGLMGRVQYNPNLFEEEVIRNRLDEFQSILGLISDSPWEKLSRITLPRPAASRV